LTEGLLIKHNIFGGVGFVLVHTGWAAILLGTKGLMMGTKKHS
jgi:hypothetical protein